MWSLLLLSITVAAIFSLVKCNLCQSTENWISVGEDLIKAVGPMTQANAIRKCRAECSELLQPTPDNHLLLSDLITQTVK